MDGATGPHLISLAAGLVSTLKAPSCQKRNNRIGRVHDRFHVATGPSWRVRNYFWRARQKLDTCRNDALDSLRTQDLHRTTATDLENISSTVLCRAV